MRFVPYPPASALAPFVELLWYLEGTPTYRREKVLPNGVVELIFNLGEPHRVVDPDDALRSQLFRRAWIAGIQRRFLVIQATRGSHLLGVRLRPAGAAALLGVPMSALADRVLEVEEVWGGLFAELHERLFAARTARERLSLVEGFLLGLWSRGRREPDAIVQHVADELWRSGGNARIGELRREVGLSHRGLLTRFERHVGLAPRRFGRIVRLQSALALAGRTRPRSWAHIAAECGFSDQAHLIREFRELTGETPTSYWRRRDEDENHVIVD